MLAELHIRNFAIIDELAASFGPGLTVITGETGAGKSILVNALNLILGSRGSAELIRSGSEGATVSALFSQGDFSDEQLVVRRNISASGRSRVYINNELGTVATLSRWCRGLVSISGQHEHQLFLDPEVQLQVVDRFGALEETREAYARTFTRLRQVNGQVARMKREARERREKEELRRYQLEEIEKSQIQEDEEVRLAEERELLRHAEHLQKGAASAHQMLYAESGAVLEQVNQCQRLLAELGRLDDSLRPVAETLQEIQHQVEDVSLSLRDYSRRIQADPARLQWVEERLDLLNRLMKKYGGSSRSVLAEAKRLREELEATERDETEISALEEELERISSEALSRALELSAARGEAGQRLGRAVEEGLAPLGMPKCQFSVHFYQERASGADSIQVGEYLLDRTGMDSVVFFFSANPGEEPRPMAKIASGGELSRILLALKELQAREGAEETLVFDEVDAGIGGRTAEMIGQRLKALSRRHQVICITHLPQIACYGDCHYAVRKHTRGERTATTVEELRGDQRLEEIARMLGGLKVSDKTRAHAREMLDQAQKSAGSGQQAAGS